MKFKRCWK